MADKKIVDLPELTTPANNDKIEIVDTSDTTDDPTGSSKYIELDNLNIPDQGVNSTDSPTFAGITNDGNLNFVELDGRKIQFGSKSAIEDRPTSLLINRDGDYANVTIRTDGSGNIIIADTGGNVGIGTSSPDCTLQVNNTIGFESEYDNGSKTASHTIDFKDGQKQKVTYTANTMTTTLSAPAVGNYQLKIVNGGLATITWSTVKWPGGTAPTLTSSGTDIISLYYDGTDFWGNISLDFS